MTFKIKTYNPILLFFILTICSSCNGQKASGTSKGQKEVISAGKTVSEMVGGVMIVFQDKQDNYWFGSNEKGVYKFDRKRITHFTKEDGLCSDGVWGIQEDKAGNIYFDTQEGVSKFDGQQFTTLDVIESTTSSNDWKLKPGDLWFRMGWNKNGPYRYDGESLYQLEFPKTDLADEFYLKYPNASYNPYGIYTMYRDSKGSVWFGTASLGACRFDGKSISWLYERQLTETPGGGDFGIRSIIEDKNGYFWFCNPRYRYEILPTGSGSNETSQIDYNRKAGVGKSGGHNENDLPYFMSIAEDNDGDLWMVTYNDGVWRNNGKELIHYPIEDDEKEVLLFSIYRDNQGILWLGTHNAGVYKFNGNTFEKFNP
jgi:ligand-binding sensor domain-containing protein